MLLRIAVTEAVKQHEEKAQGTQAVVQRTVSMPAIPDSKARTTAIFMSPQPHASVPEDDEVDSGIASGYYERVLSTV